VRKCGRARNPLFGRLTIVQPSRLKTGLVLIPLLAFVLAWHPDLLTAFQTARGSSTGSKKSATGKSTKSATASKKSSAHTAGKGTSKGATKGTATAKRRSSKRGSRSARQAPRQTQPEPDRIREIQQALKNHGYAVEPSGVWDVSTVEAVKKFQEDQNIENLSGRGKLDSLTLIALGLGPKREPPAGSSEAPQRSPEGHFP